MPLFPFFCVQFFFFQLCIGYILVYHKSGQMRIKITLVRPMILIWIHWCLLHCLSGLPCNKPERGSSWLSCHRWLWQSFSAFSAAFPASFEVEITLLWAKLEATSKAARPGIFKCGQFLVHQCGKTYVPTALYVYERKRINVSKVFASTRATSRINTAQLS